MFSVGQRTPYERKRRHLADTRPSSAWSSRRHVAHGCQRKRQPGDQAQACGSSCQATTIVHSAREGARTHSFLHCVTSMTSYPPTGLARALTDRLRQEARVAGLMGDLAALIEPDCRAFRQGRTRCASVSSARAWTRCLSPRRASAGIGFAKGSQLAFAVVIFGLCLQCLQATGHYSPRRRVRRCDRECWA
jgi:hypothetical protein